MFEKCTTKNTVMWLLHPRCVPIWAKMSVNTLLDLYMNRSLNLSSWWTRPLLAEIQSFSYFRSLKLLTITRLYSKLGCNVTGCVDVYTTFCNRLKMCFKKRNPVFQMTHCRVLVHLLAWHWRWDMFCIFRIEELSKQYSSLEDEFRQALQIESSRFDQVKYSVILREIM